MKERSFLRKMKDFSRKCDEFRAKSHGAPRKLYEKEEKTKKNGEMPWRLGEGVGGNYEMEKSKNSIGKCEEITSLR